MEKTQETQAKLHFKGGQYYFGELSFINAEEAFELAFELTYESDVSGVPSSNLPVKGVISLVGGLGLEIHWIDAFALKVYYSESNGSTVYCSDLSIEVIRNDEATFVFMYGDMELSMSECMQV